MGLVESPVRTSSKGTFRVKTTGPHAKIAVSADGTGLVSHVGGVLLMQTLQVSGLDRGLPAALERWRPGRAVHDPGKIITDLVVALAMGGDYLADIAVLRAQPELHGPVASDKWLEREARRLSTRSLEAIGSILKRAVTRAQARDKVKRNVVLLCETPKGRTGRPSKALTLDQAEEVLAADDGTPMHAYVVVSLLTGARTEEMRGLRWDHVVAFDEQRQAWTPVPDAGWAHEKFAIYVWHSVRAGGDTKTKKSRRSLALPKRSAEALRRQWDACPAEARGSGLVFCAATGEELDKDTVRRAFRRVLAHTSLDPTQWTPREVRHSFVSLLDDADVSIEKISRLVGHADTATTETVYRFQIRPVIQDGATAMDEIFPGDYDDDSGGGGPP
jgi:integrase